MDKVIAAINVTLDGFCDHTLMIADEEVHQYYTDLLNSSGTIIYGRATYELMKSYWPDIVETPTDSTQINEFAKAIEHISKVVFSNIMKDPGWKNARMATHGVEEEVASIRQQSDRDILVGSPSVIAACNNLEIVDEYQLNIHPVIAGKGLTRLKTSLIGLILN